MMTLATPLQISQMAPDMGRFPLFLMALASLKVKTGSNGCFLL
jgi:hypothetical protein